jgi:hypothetical protein
LTLSSGADGWFDSYGEIPWVEESARLDNLAIYLHQYPDFIGYIAFYRGKNESRQQFRARLDRAKRHLVSAGKAKIEQLVFVDAGKREKRWTILQPVEKGKASPKFF